MRGRAAGRTGAWLVAYDIASPRRLARLHRWLVQRALPVQYSVFVFTGTAAELAELIGGIALRIHPRQDDVRLYPLERGRPVHVLGQPLLVEGVFGVVLPPGARDQPDRLVKPAPRRQSDVGNAARDAGSPTARRSRHAAP
jgi:CRISPR-associated protein Cas2